MIMKRCVWFGLAVTTASILACGKSPQTLDQECSAGRAPSCIALGDMSLSGNGVTKDAMKAAMLFERACEARDAGGCDKARQVHQAHCDKGASAGCSLLGRMYLEGFGVAEDHPRALGLYRKACDLGSAVDCSNLAMMYAEGKGVAADAGAAAALWRKACEGGFADACNKGSKP